MFSIRHTTFIHETLHVCCSKHCSVMEKNIECCRTKFFTRASNFVMGTYECKNVIKRRDAPDLPGKSNVELDESEHGGQLGRPQLARSVRMDGGHRLSVLLKDLINVYHLGIKYDIPLSFNALSSTQLFRSMGKEKPNE